MYKRLLALLGILLLAFVFLAIYAPLRSQDYIITLPTATKPTKPITIALLSDLHSGRFYQDEIVRTLQEREVHIIALSGDMIDDKEDMQGAWEFFKRLDSKLDSKKEKKIESNLALIPKFYVSGNHEFWSGEMVAIKQRLASYNVSVLDFSRPCTMLSINGLEIAVFGVDDPYYNAKSNQHIDQAIWDRAKWKGGFWEQEWQELVASTIHSACSLESSKQADFSILLSHRPEFIELFKSLPINLILSGHTHGGQVRIPYLLNGLYAPNQGLFPKYAGGIYELDSSKRQHLIVSRGLSLNYRLPRIFNPPEIVFITLK